MLISQYLGSLEGLSGIVVSYAYGDSEWKDLLTAYNGNAISYDAIGNPLTYKNGEVLSWQNGIRTQKSVNGTTTEYFLNGSTVIAQKTGDSVIWYYYDSTGTREAIEYNGNIYYYYYNAT